MKDSDVITPQEPELPRSDQFYIQRGSIRLGAATKHILLVLLATAAWAFCADAPASTQPTSQPANLVTLEDPKGCFKFDYPAAWTRRNESSPLLSVVSLAPAPVVSDFLISVDATPDIPRSQVDPMINLTLDTVRRENGTVQSDDHLLLDHAPARQIVFTETKVLFTMKGLELMTIRNGKQYIVTYSAPPNSFDEHRTEVDALLKSFKWTDSAK
jgi:hypothetical protein